MIRAIAGATPAEREAIEWLVRLQDPQTDVQPFLALQAWLEARPENPVAYDRVQSLWNELGQPDLRRALEWRRPPVLTRRTMTAGGGLAIAASIVAAVVVTGGPMGRESLYEAPRGEQREIALKDGSVLNLAAGSQVRVRLGWRGREAVLARGEVLFDIAHETSRPFRVKVNDQQIEVLGTAFDVRQRNDGFQLTVLRGLVRVSPQGGGDGVTLARGDHVERRAGVTSAVFRGAPQDIAQWRAGRRVYSNSPLAAVVADLNTVLEQRVRLDPSAASIRFSGILQVTDGASMLKQLQAVLPVTSRTTTDGVVLSAAKT